MLVVSWRTLQAAQEEEKRLVARVVHLMRNEDTDRYFRMLIVARRHLGQVRCAGRGASLLRFAV